MATISCPPGYACPPPTQVAMTDVVPSGNGWQYLYTPFENQGDPETNAIAEYMDFEFQCNSHAGLLSAFEQEAPLEFWNAWRQQFVNAGSDMYTAKVYVQPPASFPGTATYRIVVVHSLALDEFLDFVADLIGTIAKSPFLIVFLGIVFFGQTIVAALKAFCQQVAGDYCHPIGSAQNVFIWVTVVGGVASILGWLIINELSKHEGTGAVAPPAPPAFGSPTIHTQTGLHLGPVSTEAGVSGGDAGYTPARLVSQGKRAADSETKLGSERRRPRPRR